MSIKSIEAVIAPDNLHFVGDGFRVYGMLGRKEPPHHETHEPISFIGLCSASLLCT